MIDISNPAYENKVIMEALVVALHSQCSGNEFVLYRQFGKWVKYTGSFKRVLAKNTFVRYDLGVLLDENKFELIYDFKHAAIVRPYDKEDRAYKCDYVY